MNRSAVFRGNQNGQFNHGTSVIVAVIPLTQMVNPIHIRILSLFCVALFCGCDYFQNSSPNQHSPVTPSLPPPAQQEESTTDAQPTWDALHFGSTYHIERITLTVPANSKQELLFGLDLETINEINKGPLEASDSELNAAVVTDKQTIEQIENSFQEFLRLESNGSSAYGTWGSLKIKTNRNTFVITVSERGFVLGTGTPTNENTFYNWALAKLIDDQLRTRHDTGLKSKYIDWLSGKRQIDMDRKAYDRLK